MGIHRILQVKNDPNYTNGSKVAVFVLDNGSEKRVSVLGGLPDDDTQARTAILAREAELFGKGRLWEEQTTNIESSDKSFNDNLPVKANINAANSVPALRDEVAKLRDAVQALSERL